MARRRRPPVEEPANHERWLVSYADFITLLFAFFVVMYSVSSVNEGKFRVLSDTLVAAFKTSNRSMDPIQIGKLARSPLSDDVSPLTRPVAIDPTHHGKPGSGRAPPDAAKQVDPDATGAAAALTPIDPLADLETVATRVESTMAPLIDQDLVNVRMGESWIEVEFNTSILFGSGSARLAPAALPVLTDVAEILKALPNPIQVEGYTDNVPISTETFPSNWELSAARAASVVHLFMKAGIRPQRMAAIGYGEYQPIDDNGTPEGRSRNRRVVLVIPADNDARQTIDLQRLSGGRSGARRDPAPAPAPAPVPETRAPPR